MSWLRRSDGGLLLRGPAFDPRLGRVWLWWTKWHWDRFFSQYLCFLSQYHSANAPLTLTIDCRPCECRYMTHLEPIVNQLNPPYILMPGFLKLNIIVSTSRFPKWMSSPVSLPKYIHVACLPFVLHDRYSWHRPVSGCKGFSPIRQELGTMRRSRLWKCLDVGVLAQTADIGGQADTYGVKFVV